MLKVTLILSTSSFYCLFHNTEWEANSTVRAPSEAGAQSQAPTVNTTAATFRGTSGRIPAGAAQSQRSKAIPGK